QAAERKAEHDVAAMQDAVNDLAVNAFMSPPGGGLVEQVQSDDLSQAKLKETYIDFKADQDFDVLDRLTQALDTLQQRRHEAAEVAKQKQEALGEVESSLQSVTNA